MKTLKKCKKLNLTVISIGAIIVFIVFIAILFSSKLNASGTIPTCPVDGTTGSMVFTSANASGHTYMCTSHGKYVTEEHSGKTCTLCGYEEKCEHVGGNHQNTGLCDLCGERYLNHTSNKSNIVDYNIYDDVHVPIYSCNYSGCEDTWGGTQTDHNYVNGECECGAKEVSGTIPTCPQCSKTMVFNSADGSKHTYVCTSDGKTVTEEHTKEILSHTPGDKYTHDINQRCTVCEREMVEFENHWYVDGKCTKCEYIHEPHQYYNGICAICGNYGKCSICFQGTLLLRPIDSIDRHGYYCSYCDSYYNQEKHDWILTYEDISYDGIYSGGQHFLNHYCTVCKDEFNITEFCFYENGICIDCKGLAPICSVCSQVSLVGPQKISETEHGYYCSYCDDYYDERGHYYEDGRNMRLRRYTS